MPIRQALKKFSVFNKWVLILVSASFLSTNAWAADFIEGTHYEVLPVAVETNSDDKVEVVEVFSYACIHCFNFDPLIEAWHVRQTEGVGFQRLPAIFSADWELLAQAYYAAETLGVTAAVHTPMFEGIHIKNQDLRQTALLAGLFADVADVSEEDFNTAFNSFSVRSRVQQNVRGESRVAEMSELVEALQVFGWTGDGGAFVAGLLASVDELSELPAETGDEKARFAAVLGTSAGSLYRQ